VIIGGALMEKLKVFLDTNVIVSYFQGRRDVVDLFSKKVLEKVQYIVNPIVYQEIILVMERMQKNDPSRIDLEKLDDFVEVVQIDRSKMDFYINKMREFRNLLVHTNDILILQTAILECDYLLTLDNNLLQISQIDSLKIVSPREYFIMLGVRQ